MYADECLQCVSACVVCSNDCSHRLRRLSEIYVQTVRPVCFYVW